MTSALLPAPTLDVAPAGVLADLLDLWAAVRGGQDLESLLLDVEQQTARVIESSQVDEIVRLRETYRRLAVRVARTTSDDATRLLTLLASVDRMLDAGRTAANLRRNAEVLQAQRGTLRERVLELLSDGEPRRPRVIAQALATGSPQISRVLRELVRDGKLTRAEQPAGAGDQRAHWYALAR